MRFTATRAKTLATSLLIVTAGLGLAACSGSSSSDSTTPATKQTAGKTSDGGVATPSADSKMTGGATGGSAQPTAPQGQQPGGDNQQGGQQPGGDNQQGGQQQGGSLQGDNQQGGQQPGQQHGDVARVDGLPVLEGDEHLVHHRPDPRRSREGG